ncbi:MAG: M3 family metallopeptidase [Candidatus Hodarchaeota archaeon]
MNRNPEPLGLKPRKYFDQSLDGNDSREIRKQSKSLLKELIGNTQELVEFIEKYSELYDMVEDKTLLIFARYLTNMSSARNIFSIIGYGLRAILPLLKTRTKSINKIYESEYYSSLPPEYDQLKRLIDSMQNKKKSMLQAAVEYINVGLYQLKIQSCKAELDGKKLSIPRAIAILKDQDRDKRENAWRAIYGVLLEKKAGFNKIYSRLLKLRVKKAKKNGFDNCRDYYHHDVKKRFDYTPEDCFKFHDSVEEVVVPFIKELNEKKCNVLGIESMRPWDKIVDPSGKELKPYESVDDLIKKMIQIFSKIKREYGQILGEMYANDFIDPENRKGKVAGAMSLALADHRAGYIIANAVGMDSDVFTIAHEGGHSVHWAAATSIPIAMYHEMMLFPMEVAEVGSMAMAFLILDHLGEIYDDPEDIKRAKRAKLESAMRSLPYYMTIDRFQHEIYTNPDHTVDERMVHFRQLVDRFDGAAGVNYDGLENEASAGWLKQTHVFQSPFYYIEYAIAQLAALGIYKNLREKGEIAIQQYDDFINLGNSRSLPELYEAAGVKFDFSTENIKSLTSFVKNELSNLE